jgi:hypothetical protein
VPLATWEHFGGGHGVVYGIVLSDTSGQFLAGDLYWNSFDGYMTGTGTFSGLQPVGTGWNSFSHVFAAGEGTIYGVRPDGVLRWYRHTGWTNGASTWDEPRDLNTGIDWNQFERLVSGGEGVIYAMLANGAMRCYRHTDWRTGGDRLEGPLPVGAAWRFYRPLFAALPGAMPNGPG